MNQTVKVLWWKQSTGAVGIERVYFDNDERATQDFQLLSIAESSKIWKLVDAPLIQGSVSKPTVAPKKIKPKS